MALPTLVELDISIRGGPFVKVDLITSSDGLDIADSGSPFIGYICSSIEITIATPADIALGTTTPTIDVGVSIDVTSSAELTIDTVTPTIDTGGTNVYTNGLDTVKNGCPFVTRDFIFAINGLDISANGQPLCGSPLSDVSGGSVFIITTAAEIVIHTATPIVTSTQDFVEEGLDYGYGGFPFVDVSVVVDSDGLDVSYYGTPFIRTSKATTTNNVEVNVTPATLVLGITTPIVITSTDSVNVNITTTAAEIVFGITESTITTSTSNSYDDGLETVDNSVYICNDIADDTYGLDKVYYGIPLIDYRSTQVTETSVSVTTTTAEITLGTTTPIVNVQTRVDSTGLDIVVNGLPFYNGDFTEISAGLDISNKGVFIGSVVITSTTVAVEVTTTSAELLFESTNIEVSASTSIELSGLETVHRGLPFTRMDKTNQGNSLDIVYIGFPFILPQPSVGNSIDVVPAEITFEAVTDIRVNAPPDVVILVYSAEIIMENTYPTINDESLGGTITGSFTINNEDLSTDNPVVNLALTYSENVTHFHVRCSDMSYGSWKPITSSLSWVLPTGCDGSKTIYVQYKDNINNIISSEYSQSIILTSPDLAFTTVGQIGWRL